MVGHFNIPVPYVILQFPGFYQLKFFISFPGWFRGFRLGVW
jgi:hypothetical protein